MITMQPVDLVLRNAFRTSRTVTATSIRTGFSKSMPSLSSQSV